MIVSATLLFAINWLMQQM